MKRTLALALALALTLGGCGGSNDFARDDSGSSQTVLQQSGLTGRVVGEDGAPLVGVRMVMQERTTRQETQAVSGGGGRFFAELPPGVYDVGLNLEGDPERATAFYGPVTVDPVQRRDFVLPLVGGQPAGRVFGRVFSRHGVPAAQRKVVARPGFLAGKGDGNDDLLAVSTLTGGDGSFSLDLGTSAEIGMDLEISESDGTLDEFIDVGKLSKPLYLEFTVEESPVENQLRVHEAAPEESAFGLLSTSPGEIASTITKFTDLVRITDRTYEAIGGNIPPDSGQNKIEDLWEKHLQSSTALEEFARTQLEVKSKGSSGGNTQ